MGLLSTLCPFLEKTGTPSDVSMILEYYTNTQTGN